MCMAGRHYLTRTLLISQGILSFCTVVGLAVQTWVQRARGLAERQGHVAAMEELNSAKAEVERKLEQTDRGWTKEKERVQRIKLEAASAAALANQKVQLQTVLVVLFALGLVALVLLLH